MMYICGDKNMMFVYRVNYPLPNHSRSPVVIQVT